LPTGTKKRRSPFETWPYRKGKEGLVRDSTKNGRTEGTVSTQILLAGLGAVIAVNVLVAVIAIVRAFREEAYQEVKKIRRFSDFAPS
jgi:uncharacterized membrane protein